LRVSWLFGPDPGFSEVEVRLTPENGGRTLLQLEHVAVVPAEFQEQYGPGAGGVGWDLTLQALDWHLHGRKFEVPEWESTLESKQAATHSARAWGDASLADA
jgi:hypothetical protein